MKKTARVLLAITALTLPMMVQAQVPVTAASSQQALLISDNAQLKANKQLVYDFWREVFEGGHLEKADQYLSEDYIQHNPNVPTGRKGFVDFHKKLLVVFSLGSGVKMQKRLRCYKTRHFLKKYFPEQFCNTPEDFASKKKNTKE